MFYKKFRSLMIGLVAVTLSFSMAAPSVSYAAGIGDLIDRIKADDGGAGDESGEDSDSSGDADGDDQSIYLNDGEELLLRDDGFYEPSISTDDAFNDGFRTAAVEDRDGDDPVIENMQSGEEFLEAVDPDSAADMAVMNPC